MLLYTRNQKTFFYTFKTMNHEKNMDVLCNLRAFKRTNS